MKHKTQALALLLCTALCVGLLGGCASIGTSPQGPDESAAAPPDVSQPQQPEPQQPAAAPECDPLTGAAPSGTASRPVAVMIDNLIDALPQSGIAAASVVYEMVTEGGIPRMMAVFPSTAALNKVGPVRSVRDQFVQLLVPEDMVLLHIGSSIYAADMLRAQEYATVDGIYLGTVAFAFDEARAQTRDNSHCFYTSAALADAGIAQQGIDPAGAPQPLFGFVPYDGPARVPDALAAGEVAFSFSMVAPVAFRYDAASARYLKSEYGDPQMDEGAGVQLSYTNLLILGCDVALKSDGLCTDFDFSAGDGFYFSQGGGQPVRWQKGDVTDRLQLFDEQGQPLQLNVGNTYVAFADNRALARSLTADGTALWAGDTTGEVPENGAGA